MSFYNNKYTKYLIGALVLMNTVLLFAFFTVRPPERGQHPDKHERKRIEAFLKSELNLSKEQVVKFKELREAHFAERRAHWQSIRPLKKEMMEALSSETPDTLQAKSIADQIGQLEAEKEKMLIDHYLKLQAECTPEQREKLADVFQRAMKPKRFHKKRGERKREAN
ncbi:MAG: periplasmic heavy metal sensor [Bacteroidota bacterium]